ncbi:MAG: hypothetical protein MJ131_08725 [Lachnospiraceae bacterium]|nr:hypothetical protein [Lachnospiraceae bacterium]
MGSDCIIMYGKKTIHIRYILVLVIIILMSVFLTGCRLFNTEKELVTNALPNEIMINNCLYKLEGTVIEIAECFKADGVIQLSSGVEGPLENNQTNYSDYIGCEYGFIDGKLYLLYKGKLHLLAESYFQPHLDEILDPQALRFTIADAERNIKLPFLCDFSSDEWMEYAYVRAENQFQNWYAEKEADESGTENLYLTRKLDEALENMHRSGMGPTVLWGQGDLTDYSFGFDFKIEAEDTISFAAFFQNMKTSCMTEGKAAILDTWLTFDEKDGVRKYCSDSCETIISMEDERLGEYYRYAEWNHIELYLKGLDLHMTLNGYELGTVFSFTDTGTVFSFINTPHGSAGIGSNGGSKFRNISIN